MNDALSVCIPIDPPEHGGGGFRFLRNFASYLDRQGVPRTRDVAAGARVLFVNSWQVPWHTIIRAAWHRPDVTVVHRIDGAAQDYGREPTADRVQARVNRLADVTIFQSAYCRYSTRVKFPVIAHDGPVIHNPVDTSVFAPEGPRASFPNGLGPRVAAVTWSTNPRKGAASLYRLAAALPRTRFILVGRFNDAPNLPNIVRTGVLGPNRLAMVLRSCDVLATFSENEACPNVVLEGLASGLPILYRDSGAARELVANCGSAVTEETFAAELVRVMSELPEVSVRARAMALERFHPDRIFAEYLGAIRAALRPRGSRLLRVGALALAAR